MTCYLVRHGMAAAGSNDWTRPLTPEGRAAVEGTARALAARGTEVAEIRHSTHHARETAEIIGGVLTPAAGIRATIGLAPEDAPSQRRSSSWPWPPSCWSAICRTWRAWRPRWWEERPSSGSSRPGDGGGSPARRGRLGGGAGGPAARRDGAVMPHLVCVRCGVAGKLGPAFEGCMACAGEPRPALEVVYDYAALAAAGTLKAWASRPGGLWRFPGAPATAGGRVDPEPGGGRDTPGAAAGCR